MDTIHIINLEEHNPGYKDRNLIWCKVYFKMINADPNFEMLCEIDKWRFVALVMLELQIKQPIPLDLEYLKRKGFDFKKRAMSLTIQMLHNLIEVCNETVTQSRVEKSRKEEKREEKKEKHLDFVFLTPEEYKELTEKLGDSLTASLIEELNDYVGSKGVRYKSHYHTILSWSRRKAKEGKSGGGKTKLKPLFGKTCGERGCNLPAVYIDKSGDYDNYKCSVHLPASVKESYE